VGFCGRVEVRGSHPSLEKSEGWGTQLYGLVKGAPPATRATRLTLLDLLLNVFAG